MMTPMDWTLNAMRTGMEFWERQMRLTQALVEVGLQQQQALLGMAAQPVTLPSLCGTGTPAAATPARSPAPKPPVKPRARRTAAPRPKVVASRETPAPAPAAAPAPAKRTRKAPAKPTASTTRKKTTPPDTSGPAS